MINIRTTKLFILFFGLLPQLSSGQSSIGLRIFSPQFSNFTERVGVYQNLQNSKYTQSNLTGLLLGVTSRIQLKNRHYLHVELLYSMRGESYKYTAYDLNGYSLLSLSGGQPSLNYYLDYRTHYIEIPVMYCIDLTHNQEEAPIHVYLSSGFSVGINVVSKLAQNSFSVSSPGSGISAIDEHDTTSPVTQTNPLILNFVTDLDFEFRRRKKTKVFFYGRLNRSLTSVFNQEYNMNTKLITYGFGFGLRWYLKSAG